MHHRLGIVFLVCALADCSRTDVVDIRRDVTADNDPTVTSRGDDVGAGNTGFSGYVDPALGRPLTESDLVPCTDSMLTTPGAVVERCRFSGGVAFGADDITLRGCLVDMGLGGPNEVSIDVSRLHVHIEYCTVRADTNASAWIGIRLQSTGSVVEHNDISGVQQGMVDTGTDSLIQYNFIHFPPWDGTGGSGTCISVYDGANHTIRVNRLLYPAHGNACVDISPFASGQSVDGVRVEDNFVDGGNTHVIAGASPPAVGPYNVRVLRNHYGGHTNPSVSRYAALNSPGSVVQTDAELAANNSAILWPSTGPDVNSWSECSDLTPDQTGEIVTVD